MSKPKQKPVTRAEAKQPLKQPALGANLQSKARVPAAAAFPSHEGTPCFRFSRMDLNGPFSWSNASKGMWFKILAQLGKLESLNRPQCAAQGSHDYAIADCSKKARDRFTDLKLDVQFDSVFSVRVEGKVRVICIDLWPVLELLWLDTNHEVYPSSKKHT